MVVDIILYGGGRYTLPQLISWKVTHGLGEPCDSIELCCAWDAGMARVMPKAYRLAASHGGETVFFGVLDEWEAAIGPDGAVLSLSGRGLAALLLDNEAEAARFGAARLEDIIEKYVKPFGITDISAQSMGIVRDFIVNSGTCAWNVLYSFTCAAAGIRPRFSRSGRLVLGSGGAKIYALGASGAVLELRRRDRRCGVVSEVIVKNGLLGTERSVKNEGFVSRGGAARRVVNVPRYTSWDAMRYTGEFQIAESERGKNTVEVTLAELFTAEPGDIILLDRPEAGLCGSFMTAESAVSADGDGARTVLTLEEVKNVAV